MEDPFTSSNTPAPSGVGNVPDFDPRQVRVQAELDRSGREDTHPDGRPLFRPMSDLPIPDPQPGFTHRYIRVSNNQQADTRNMGRRFAEGWTPCGVEEQPRVAKLLGRYGVNADGNIEIGGLMLCKLPTEIKQARDRYYSTAAQNQIDAVNTTYMRDENRRMPKLAPEHNTTVSFPGARPAA